MENGEWRMVVSDYSPFAIHHSLRQLLLLLEAFLQGEELFAENLRLRQERGGLCLGAEFHVRRNQQVGFQFLEAAVGCPQKLDELRPVVSPPSLRDIRWNGGGCTPDL